MPKSNPLDTTMKKNPYIRLFANKNFIRIWLAQLLGQLSSNLLNFALIIKVFDLAADTQYASISVSILVLAFGVPSIIFALLAGAYVDHLDRKKVLVYTNLIRGILVLLLLAFGNNLLAIYAIVFAISIFSQFFIPAESASLPRLVSKKELAFANSLFLFTLYGSFAVGYAMAGPIISAFGQNAVYWTVSAAFLVASVLCWLLPKMQPKRTGETFTQINQQAASTIYATTKKIFASPKLLLPIINLTIIQMMIGVIAVIAPALSLVLFSQNLAQASAKIIIPVAIGMLLGAVSSGTFLRKINRVVLIDASMLVAVAVLVFSYFLPNFKEMSSYDLIIVTGLFMVGFAVALISVTAQTLLQTNSSDDERGKIFGTLNMMINIAASVPILLAGVLADVISPLSVLAISGALIGVYGVYQFITVRRHEKIYEP